MTTTRLIARLDVKGPNLIKTVHLEGLRKLGNPAEFARRYYAEGIDELLYIDAVASLYGRNSLTDVVRSTARDVFIPITVGGGLRSVEDVAAMLRAGADKVAINTAAVNQPSLIHEVSRAFGSQCMVLSIQAKQRNDGTWEAYSDMGREHTGRDVVEWAREGCALGAGEILLTSIDREGTRRGVDLELTQRVSNAVPIPVIASGGIGEPQHIVDAVRDGCADAVAMAYVLHYNDHALEDLRAAARDAGIAMRPAT